MFDNIIDLRILDDPYYVAYFFGDVLHTLGISESELFKVKLAGKFFTECSDNAQDNAIKQL